MTSSDIWKRTDVGKAAGRGRVAVDTSADGGAWFVAVSHSRGTFVDEVWPLSVVTRRVDDTEAARDDDDQHRGDGRPSM